MSIEARGIADFLRAFFMYRPKERRYGGKERHPQQNHRLYSLDIRFHRVAPILLRQTGFWNNLLLYPGAALHRMDH
ncbi:uncharacterized protein Dmul_08050 [Desulfococcus multivorans]|nr:uncharacterized protein Dmul_08050 [Desulfococcus multivorans]